MATRLSLADSMRGKTISCHVCEKPFKALKRCKSCKSTFYCSRECQIHDWPTHKPQCSALKDQKETEAGEIDTLQELTLDVQTREDEKQTSRELGDNAKSLQTDSTQESPAEQPKETKESPLQPDLAELECSTSTEDEQQTSRQLGDNAKSLQTDSTQESRAEQPKETKGSPLQPDLAELKCSTSTEDSIRDHVTITVKTSRQKHCITLERQSSGANLMVDISRTVCIPHEQMKLIHKGKLMNADNIQETITDRAVFQAIGEVAENEEGLSNKEIACVMNQIKVDRNKAIKALRKTGNAIDAILYLGNK